MIAESCIRSRVTAKSAVTCTEEAGGIEGALYRYI